MPRNLLHRNIGAFSSAMLLLSFATLRVPRPTAQAATPPEGALQLTARLNPAGADASGPPAFAVEFHNSGKTALILNLGTMLANGQKLFLDGVDLLVTDPKGKTHRLFDVRTPAEIAGRVDPLILPLCAGCNFSFPVDFTNYCLADEPVLRSGQYSLEARFVGNAVSREAGDVALMPFWLGSISSNRVHFQISHPNGTQSR